MPSHTNRPAVPATAGYRFLLRNREFAGLYAGFTLTAAASTLSGFALGTLVHDRTHSPFLTAVSLYGATFAAVLGALTLMSVADGHRPRRTLVTLQCLSLAGVAAQAIPGLPCRPGSGCCCCWGSSSPWEPVPGWGCSPRSFRPLPTRRRVPS